MGTPFGLKDLSSQESVRWIEISSYLMQPLKYFVCLHKPNNVIQNFWHMQDHEKIIIFEPCRQSYPTLFLKNISGFLQAGDDYVNLWRFEKNNNGIYMQKFTPGFKRNVKEIKSKDFEHNADEVVCIFKTN
jgi:hypothetical protein